MDNRNFKIKKLEKENKNLKIRVENEKEIYSILRSKYSKINTENYKLKERIKMFELSENIEYEKKLVDVITILSSKVDQLEKNKNWLKNIFDKFRNKVVYILSN